MKSIIKSLIVTVMLGNLLNSCVKDEMLATLDPATAPILNTTIQAPIVLLQANQNNNAGTFTWTAAGFGYKAAVNYTLQFAKGSNWAITGNIDMGKSLTKTVTVKELNDKMQEIMPDGIATEVQARIKASVGNTAAPVYSNILKMTITSYLDIVTYAYPDALNIAGNGQTPQWDPPTSPQITKVRNGGYANYEGYIIFNAASPEFKMVKGNNWGAGDYGSAGPGTLGNGGPNLTLPSGGPGVTGLYRIRANPGAMTWSYDKINTFGIIGSATANGWNSSTPMTFNPANGAWSITTDLVAGEFKFRANNDWAINFGDDDDNGPQDGKPEYDDDNIPIASAGNYTISLNIGVGGNYNYKIRKN